MLVRWLGAYGKGPDLATSLQHELLEVSRQVAAEPVLGKPRVRGDLGLVVRDEAFVSGYVQDAYTDRGENSECGYLRVLDCRNRAGKRFRTLANLYAAMRRDRRAGNGWVSAEAICWGRYSAVAVKQDASPVSRRYAAAISEVTGLPVVEVKW